MAGITTVMQLYDRMTPVLRTIQTNFNAVIDRATVFQDVMSRSANVARFQADNVALSQVSQNAIRASNNAAAMRHRLTRASGAARGMGTDTSAMAGNITRANIGTISIARNAATMRHQFSRVGNDTIAINRNISSIASNTLRVRNGIESISRSNLSMNHSLTSTNVAITNMNSNMQRVLNSISGATQQQNAFNDSASRGSGIISGMANHLKGMIGIYAAFWAGKEGIEATDNYTNGSARLSLINDGLQTQAELQDKIYNAAQRSRGSYNDMVSTVAKLGSLAKDAFSANDETIAFTELMNKAFKISGASQSEISNGMYQLTQAMASGRLQGDEFRSIIENAPMLADAIGEYTGVGMEGLKKLSSQGAISAEIIKSSLFMAGDDIEKKFATMPKTFGDIWVDITNFAGKEFTRLMETITEFNNSDAGAAIVGGIKTLISALAWGLEWVIGLVMSGAEIFHDNWETIEPVIWGIVGAVTAYAVITGVAKAATLAKAAAHGIAATAILAHQLATDKWTFATFGAIAAQWGLNKALMLCPIVWVIGIIIAILAALAAWHVKNNGLKVSILQLWHTIATGFENIRFKIVSVAYKVMDAWGEVKVSFKQHNNDIANSIQQMCVNGLIHVQNFVNGAIDAYNSLVSTVNRIVGTSFELASHVTFGADAQIKADADKAARELDLIDYRNEIEAASKQRVEQLEKMKYMDNLAATDRSNKIRIAMEERGSKSNTDIWQDWNDYGSEIPSYLEDIAGNTGAMRDSMEINKEDLKYMRDIAEREAITKKIEINVDAKSTNQVGGTVDLDGMVTYLGDKIQEAMSEAAEGVHI